MQQKHPLKNENLVVLIRKHLPQCAQQLVPIRDLLRALSYFEDFLVLVLLPVVYFQLFGIGGRSAAESGGLQAKLCMSGIV